MPTKHRNFRRIILIWVLWVWVCSSFAQTKEIGGILKDIQGNPVAYASVQLIGSSNKLITFKASNQEGAFLLKVPDSLSLHEARLEIHHLGYKKIRIDLLPDQVHYIVLMEEQAVNLSEVKVKSRPRIRSIGDTLSYDVESFAKKEDRSIGDVIKRLPGMEVSENGQMKFNGQNIDKLYIDGDDLLGDKYHIGTKTIPYAMVKGVEVLQNHQALKVLKNRVLSDKISLNLVIKDEAKLDLSGQARLGAGLPRQFDAEINSMLFNKKYKMLNVLNGNNIGDDLAANFSGFDYASSLTAAGNYRPGNLLSQGTVSPPALPKSRYFLNRSGALNANNLINLENGLQLKSNIQLLADRNTFAYRSATEIYSGQDTIRYNEVQNALSKPLMSAISVHAQSNKDHYYFNNSTVLGYSKTNSTSDLQSDQFQINQNLENRINSLLNTLDYVPQLQNGAVLSLQWYLNYYNQPESLFIEPGTNPDVLNGGEAFQSSRQLTESPTWFSNASLSYRLPRGAISQTYRAGMLNESQNLTSQLRLSQPDGSITPYGGSSDNDLEWKRNQVFIGGSFEYKKKSFESVLSIPIVLQSIAYRDSGFDLDESETRLLVQPDLRIRYLTGVEDYLSFQYNFNNETGNSQGVYRGAILRNYRRLNANDADLQEKTHHRLSFRYHFRRSLSMLFMNAGFNINRSRANSISASVINSNIEKTVQLPFVNDVNSLAAHAGIDKYIFWLGATAGLKSSWSSTTFNQLFNEELLPFHVRSFMLNPEVEARLFDKIAISYKGTMNWTNSTLEGQASTADLRVRNLNESIGFSYSPAKVIFLRASGRHYWSEQAGRENLNYFFADIHLRYVLSRWRSDFEVDIRNLANVKTYETFSVSANRFTHDQYQLRGRMLMFRYVFNF